MKNILYSATVETHNNKYVFRENEKLDKKYYVVLDGFLQIKRNVSK